jgi:cytochrome P450
MDPASSVDVCDCMMMLTLQIVSQSMFSLDSGPLAQIVRDASRDYQEAMMVGVPDFVPGIGALWGLYKAARARGILRHFNRAIRQIIAARKAQIPSTAAARDDLLQRLIGPTEAGARPAMSASEVRDQVFTIFVADHETTALALTWTWYLLSQRPEVEGRLHAEIDTVLGVRPPSHDDLQRLPYTRMVLEEAMRLYPPVHSLAFRTALEADVICHRRIPKGAIVSIVPWILHRNRLLWANPQSFDPERFSPAMSARRERLSYLPFGFGPRVCLGASFAVTEGILVLASMARRFRLRLAPGAQVEPQGLFTLRPRFGMPMTLERR